MRFLKLLPYISDIILVVDGENLIVDINEAAISFHGWEKGQVKGCHYLKLCKSTGLNPVFIPKNKSTPRPSDIEQVITITTMEGVRKTAKWSVIPLDNSEEKAVSVLIGKELGCEVYGGEMQSEQLLKALIESLPGNYWWKDLDGVYRGANKNTVENLGVDSNLGVVGKTDYELPWVDQADNLVENDLKVIELGKTMRFEEKVRSKNGDIKTFIVTKAPLRNNNGSIVGTVGTSTDITERELMSKELKQAKEKAETANQVLGIMSASIAHELRTPLCAISSNAEGIKRYMPVLMEAYEKVKDQNILLEHEDILDGFQLLKKAPQNIIYEAQSLFTIVNMLLLNVTHTRIDAADFEDCSIQSCIDKALNRYPFTDRHRKLLNIGDGDFIFRGKELLVVHILFNLFKNAFYYIDSIDRGEVYICIKPGKKKNTLLFKDTGPGIDPGILPHIFDKYFSKTQHGAGIGLAYCKMVMHSFSGQIACESEEGKYTEFKLDFPRIS